MLFFRVMSSNIPTSSVLIQRQGRMTVGFRGGSLSVVHIYLFNSISCISYNMQVWWSQMTDLVIITRPSFSIPNRASSSDSHSSQTEKQNSILLHFTALQVARTNVTATPSFLHSPVLAFVSLLLFLCRSLLTGAVLEKGLLCGGGRR